MELETLRLVIRPHTLANLEALVRWQTDPLLHRLSDDDVLPVRDGVAATLERWVMVRRDDLLHLGLHLKASGELIGYGDLGTIDAQNRRCRVGLTIGERALWGQGYGREALEGLLRIAFERLGLRRVAAHVFAFNARSLRLFDRAGFRREGVLRGHLERDGVPEDEVVFGLLRDEWAARPPTAAAP